MGDYSSRAKMVWLRRNSKYYFVRCVRLVAAWALGGALLAGGLFGRGLFAGALAAGVLGRQSEAVQGPVVVQPGAPGTASKVLPASTRGTLPPQSGADVAFMQGMIMHHAQAVEMTGLIASHTENKDLRLLGARIRSSQASEIRFMKRWLAARDEPIAMGGKSGMHIAAPGKMDMEMPVPDERSMERAGQTASVAASGATPASGTAGGAGAPSGTASGTVAGAAGQATPAGHTTATMSWAMDAAMPGMLTAEQMEALRAANGAEFDRLFLRGMIQHHQGALTMVKDLFSTAGAGQDADVFNFATDADNTQRAEIGIMESMLEKKTSGQQ